MTFYHTFSIPKFNHDSDVPTLARIVSLAWIYHGYEREVHQELDGVMRQLLIYMDIFHRPRDIQYLARLAMDISRFNSRTNHVQELVSRFLSRQVDARRALDALAKDDRFGVLCGNARAFLFISEGKFTDAYAALHAFV